MSSVKGDLNSESSSSMDDAVVINAPAAPDPAPTKLSVFEDHDYELVVDNVSYDVMVKAKGDGSGKEKKRILEDISCSISSGHLMAIIGSSGAGKTTLLDTIANRSTIKKELLSGGGIRLNGEPVSRDTFRHYCAYVPQEDRLWQAMTVRENLSYAARLTTNIEDIEGRVDRVLELLGLASCADVLIGSDFLKGVSGGQKRRCNIGVEIVGMKQVLFLDEPTSGLDSASATQVMECLTRLAKNENKLIVTSIHQPTTHVYHSFDQVLLLSKGRIAYSGQASAAPGYFESIGFKMPERFNPSDFMLAITNPDFVEDETQVDKILDAWSSSTKKASDVYVAGGAPLPSSDSIGKYARTGVSQFLILTERAFLCVKRNPEAYLVRFVLNLVMSCFLGSVYRELDKNQEDSVQICYFIVWIQAFFSYLVQSSLPLFSMERFTVAKERMNGYYTTLPYLLAQSVVQLCCVFIAAFLAVTPGYWIVGLNSAGDRYITFVVVMFSFLYIIEGLAFLCGALITDQVACFIAYPSILSMLFTFNGFFIQKNEVPDYWIWLHYLSPYKYANELMMRAVWKGQTIDGFDECMAAATTSPGQHACLARTGDELLLAVGDDLDDVNDGLNFLALWMLALGTRVAVFFVLKQI